MAHSHDRTLVQALGADIDHKSPLHDAACLYLQGRAEILATKFFIGGKKRFHEYETESTYSDPLGGFKHYIEPVLPELLLCSRCEIHANKTPLRLSVEDIGVSNIQTTLEAPVTKGDGQYRTHIGFLDLVIECHLIEKTIYSPTDCTFNRRCGYDVHRDQVLGEYHHHPKELYERLASENKHARDLVYTLQYPGKTSERESTYTQRLSIEVKIQRCPLGDLIRQINLYREYARTSRWIVATAYPLDEREVAALTNEEISAIRLADGFEAAVSRPANVDVF